MRSEIIDKALKMLEQRRLYAETETYRRTEELYLKFPELENIRNELALTSVKLTKLILSKEKDISAGIEELKSSNLALQQKEKAILKENGYADDYLEISYACKKCNDTGYIGKERCGCLKNLIRQINVKELNKNTALNISTFEDFDLSYYSKEADEITGVIPFNQMSDILNFCKKYALEFNGNSKGIFMSGATGLGKSHLSLAIANEVIKKGYIVAYGTVYDLLRTIEDENFGRVENKDTLGSLLDADLLILDDLGAEFASPFNLSAIFNIIDSRCNKGKATVISSNLSLKELEERYSKRLVSRLISLFTYLRFIGKDIRQQKNLRV